MAPLGASFHDAGRLSYLLWLVLGLGTPVTLVNYSLWPCLLVPAGPCHSWPFLWLICLI